MANINTLGSLRDGPVDDSDDSDMDEFDSEGEDNLFVGGGRNSGQAVQRPDDRIPVARIMRAARRAGAEEANEEEAREALIPRKYGSGGYRLGGHGQPSQRVGQPVAEPNAQARAAVPSVTLNIWINGFSVDNGPLRNFQDPANRQFMAQVMQRKVPTEIVQQHGRDIDFHLKQHQTEYSPQGTPFGGQGRSLLSENEAKPNVTLNPTQATGPRDEKQERQRTAQANVGVNEEEPVTRVSVRMPDGENVEMRFNHTHRVADVRSYVVTANPRYATVEFQFAGGFPVKPIADEQATLKDAGLLNTKVILKVAKN